MDKYGLVKVHNPYAKFIKNILLGLVLIFASLISVTTGFFGLNNLVSDKENIVEAMPGNGVSVYTTTGGTVTRVNYSQSVKVSANPSINYTFDRWEYSTYGDPWGFGISTWYDGTTTTNPYTFNVGLWADAWIRAYFTYTSPPVTYSVSLARGTGISSVSGAATYSYGSNVSVSANVNTGYSWYRWTGSSTNYNQSFNFTINSNMSWTANATPNTYTVTLNANGGSGGTTSVNATYGSAMPAASAPSRTGYIFGGYTTTGSVQYYTSAMASAKNWDIAQNTTLYAIWSPINYYIIFNGNTNTGGSMASQTYTYNQSQNLRANAFTKTGYVFTGWATSSGGAVVYSNSQNVVNLTTTSGAIITLYAKWMQVFLVTLDGNGATGGSTSGSWIWASGSHTQYLAAGAIGSLPNYGTLLKTGYVHDGWWTTNVNNTGTKITTSTNIGSAVTFYARWREVSPSKYSALKAPPEANASPYIIMVGGGQGVEFYANAGFGYYFDKWIINYNQMGSITYGIENTNSIFSIQARADYGWYEATAYFTPAQSNVSVMLDDQGGWGGDYQIHNINFAQPMPDVSAPSRAGHSFVGYFKYQNGLGTKYYNSNGTNIANWDQQAGGTIYAYWEIESYTINFNAHGGSTPTSISANYNTAISLIDSTRSNYNFGGWWSGYGGTGSQRTWTTMPDLGINGTTITLYARWYNTLTFDGNGNTGGSPPTPITVQTGSLLTLPWPGSLEKTHYDFLSWNTNAAGTGTNYYVDSTFSPAGHTTLYAKWIIKNYTVTFHVNEGTAVSQVQIEANTNIDLTNYTTTKENYVFNGWYANTGLTDGPYESFTITSNKSFYAKWGESDYWTDYDNRASGYAGGTGGSSTPYLISSAAQLGYLAYQVNQNVSTTGKYYKLTQDIDLGAHQWDPIGYTSGFTNRSFEGYFNGDGYTIRNMSIIQYNKLQSALFGAIIGSAIIENFTVTGTINFSANNSLIVGGALASGTGTVRNVGSYVNIDVSTSATFSNKYAYVGGVAAGVEGVTGATIVNSFNQGNISVQANGDMFVGGVAGTSPSIINAYNTGSIYVNYIYSIVTTVLRVGGVLGSFAMATPPIYENLYNYSSLTIANEPSNSQYGALIGQVAGSLGNNARVKNSYYSPNVGAAGNGIGSKTFTDVTNVLLKTTGWTTMSNFSNFDFTSDWAKSTSAFNSGSPTIKISNNTSKAVGGYLIKFDANGGTLASGTISVATSKSGIDSIGTTYMPASPTRTGYSFEGWSTTSGSSNSVNRYSSTLVTADDIWYAVWEPNDYLVIFNGNGSTSGSMANQTVEYYVVENLNSNTFSKTGHYFLGWATSSDGGVVYSNGASYTHTTTVNQTLYAKWSLQSYNITLSAGSGTSGALSNGWIWSFYNFTKSLVYGYGIGAFPTAPTKLGYTFDGWWTGIGGTGTEIATATPVPASSTTYYAKWNIVAYSISYTLNGGTTSPANATTYNITSPTFNLTNPTKIGYDFVGWSGTGLTGTTNTSVSITQGSTGSRSYTANWSAPISYSITYVMNGGTNNVANPTSYTIESSLITLANPTRSGYTFSSWSPSSTIPAGSTGNKTFTASWTGNLVTINMVGSPAAGGTPTYSEIARVGNTITLNSNVNTGYTFDGWSENGEGSIASNQYSIVAEDDGNTVTITANYTGNEVTILTETNPSSLSNNPTWTGVARVGQTITLTAQANTGYYFDGWSEKGAGSMSGNTYTIQPADSANTIIFTANYLGNQYTITFNKQNGTGGSDSAIATYASAMPSATAPTLLGWTFGGYYDAVGGGGTQYYNASMVSQRVWDKTSNTTLYVKWSTTLTLNANGGSIAANANWSGSGLTATKTITYNTAITMPTSATTSKTGYSFNSWNTASNGLGTSYLSDNTYASINTTIYAQWDINQYDITYNSGETTATEEVRYIRGFINGSTSNGGSHWVELKAWDSAGVNKGLTATSVTSSILNDDSIATSPYYSGTIVNMDLGSVVNIDKLQVWLYYGNIRAYYEYVIRISTDNVNWTEVYNSSSQGLSIGNVNGLTIDLGTRISYDRLPSTQSLDYNSTTIVSSNTYDQYVSVAYTNVNYNINVTGTYTFPTVKRQGYTFAGWRSSYNSIIYAAGATSHAMPAQAVIMTAQWTQNNYTVTYDENGGGDISNATYQTSSATFSLNTTLTRTGYTFAGWRVTTVTTATVYKSSESYAVVDNIITQIYTSSHGDISVRAQWTANTYTVTFDKQNGTGGTNSVVATYDAPMPAATAPTLLGWTFGGYYDAVGGGGTQYYNASMISQKAWDKTSDSTLFAKWTTTLIFNANGGLIAANANWTGSGATVTKIVTYNTAVTMPTSATTSKTGHTFDDWNTIINGTGTTYVTGNVYASTSTTIYAQWTPIDYTITFNYNDGRGVYTTRVVTYGLSINSDADVSMPANATRTNWTFVGWAGATSASSSDRDANTTVTSSATWYAIWAGVVTFKDSNLIQAATPSRVVGTPFSTFTNGDTTYFSNYILANTYGTSHYYEYDFYAPITGNYNISGFLYAADGSSDSFFMALDSEPFIEWHTGNGASWMWSTWGVKNLTAGMHILKIAAREATKLSAILIENQTNYASKNVVDGYGIISMPEVSMPANPARPGFTFIGWNSAIGQTTANKSGTTTITSGHQIWYSAYVRQPYNLTVTASTNLLVGGTGGGVKINTGTSAASVTVSIIYNALTSITATSNTGYNFMEWNTAANSSGTTLSTSATYTFNMPEQTTTYYAIFRQNFTLAVRAVTNSVDASDKGGTVKINSGTEGAIKSGTYPYSSTQNITATVKAGYTFLGWYTSATVAAGNLITNNATNAVTIPFANATYYAWFLGNSVNIALANNPSVAGSSSWKWATTNSQNLNWSGYTANRVGVVITITASANTGYSFNNWSENGSASVASTTTASTTYDLQAADASITVTFTANYTAINYTIVYIENGGTAVNNSTYTIESATFDLAYITKQGYDFIGWQVVVVQTATVYVAAGVYANVDNIISQIYTGSHGDITLEAQWGFSVTLTINTTFDSTVEAGITAFIAVTATDEQLNDSIWTYPLKNASSHYITLNAVSNITIVIINPTNHVASSSGQSSFVVNQSGANVVLNITVTKTSNGYIYDAYYVD